MAWPRRPLIIIVRHLALPVSGMVRWWAGPWRGGLRAAARNETENRMTQNSVKSKVASSTARSHAHMPCCCGGPAIRPSLPTIMNARLIRAVRLSQQQQLVSRSCPAHFSGARYNERQIRLATSADQSAHATCTDSPNTHASTLGSGESSSSGLFRLLTDEQRKLLDEQRRLVGKIRDVARRVGGNVKVQEFDGGLDLLPGAADAVDRTFLCCIAGEFNAGKSTLINALLGEKILESGALPTTDTVQVLAYGSNTDSKANDSDQQQSIGSTVLHLHPSALLKDLTLIDTPGTNAVHVDHTKITHKLLPVADIILFVTSADRPFPDSERKLLQSIQRFRKNLVIVLNKIDTLDTSGGDHGQKEKERVTLFVKEHSSDLLGAQPTVIAVSARDALGAKSISTDKLADNAVWKRSNFEELENFLSTTLTDKIKVRSKLLNPLGVAEGMLDDCIESLKAQKDELETDSATLRLLESQMSGWTLEMESEMNKFRSEAQNLILLEGSRCRELVQRMSFPEQIRWTLLGDRLAFEEAWIRAVAGSSIENDLKDLVRDISDDIATRARAQGQGVIEYLGKRPAVTSQSLIGSVTAASRFEDTRKGMAEKMLASVKSVCSSHDPIAEQESTFQHLRTTSIVSSVLLAASFSDGVATLLGFLELTAGVPSGSAFAIFGGLLIPLRNKSLAAAYQGQWAKSSERLDESLSATCSREVERIQSKILDGVRPYTRYVQTEESRMATLDAECEDLATSAHSLRNRINKVTE